MQNLARRVAVVGAGWAGLAAAVELARKGVSVEVFEAGREPGGRARSLELEAETLDNGQHILVGAYSETLRLMRSVGADPEQLLLRLPFGVDYPGRFHLHAARLPAPLHLAAALVRARGLTWRERLAALRFIQAMRTDRFRTAQDATVAQLLAAHRQDGALARYLWEPLCISALNTPASQASAQVFLNVLRDTLAGSAANSDLLVPQQDLGALFPRPAGAYVRARGGSVHLGKPVRRVEKREGGFAIDASDACYSQVILAVAPHQVEALLAHFPALDALRAALRGFEFEPIYTCYLRYPASVRLPQAMTGCPGPILQWVFDRGQLKGPPGLIAAVISASGDHQRLTLDALAHAAHGELAALLPQLPAPLWSRVIAEKRATYSCRPGLARPRNETGVDGLLLAGDYTAGDYPATLEAAVRSGLAAARLVA